VASNTRVLVVGDANLDLILTGDVRPRFGQTEQLLDDATLTLGGSASLVAHGLARLGIPVSLCAAVGSDTFGDQTKTLLGRAGVDISTMVTRSGIGSGLSVILSDTDRAILTQLGAIPTLTPSDLPPLNNFTHLHIASVYLVTGMKHYLPDLLRAAKEAGLSTTVDTNDDPARSWHGISDLAQAVDTLLPNEDEVIRWSTAHGHPTDNWQTAAATITALGNCALTIKRGAQGGAHLTSSGELITMPAAPIAPVDTTGAGDSFDAGWIAATCLGLDTKTVLQWAVAAGSLSTQGIGGSSAQPTREALLAAQGDLPQTFGSSQPHP
jgi:ribokinase